MAARGQSMYEYRYWFDGNEADAKTGSSDNSAWQMDLDIGQLDASLHTVFFQLKDAKGVWSVPKVRYFVKIAGSQTERIEYWFDNDSKKRETLANSGLADIDVSQLADGMHMIQVQTSASASSPRTAVFWKQAILAKSRYRLWFDNDNSNTLTGQYTGRPISIDVSQLADGFHILHAQVENASPSQPQTSMFIKVPQTQGVDYMACSFMVDGKMYRQEQVPTHGGIVNWTLDAADIEPGLHKAQAFVVTPSGAATGLKETFFYRAMTDTERKNMKCLYSIDGDEHYTEAGTLSGNLYHFDLDVANLADGFHSLSYMLMGEDGTSSKVMSSFFMKTPLGGNGIMQYDYWLNDEEASRTVTKLDKRTSPLKLITLLPVESRPIRSSCFHFEVGKDGKPAMYAKNDLHFTFYDASSRRLDDSRQFIDYNVSKQVENISPIHNTQSFGRLADNDVKWYKFNAERGDSVTFKCSQAASIQLFSSSGDELYNASGADAVIFGGTHINVNGTYYLAVHDVTGTRTDDIVLDYVHIDKYDLLGTSATVLGVMPCVQIMELDGNGFDNLKSASLVMGNTAIKANSIVCNDKSKAKLYMLFDGKEEYGKYDLVLNFNDGETSATIKRENYVELEPASFDDIEVAITDPRTVADPYPVTITLTNKSNISYQAIPFFFGVDGIDRMTSVKYMNFAVGCDKELYDNGVNLSFDYDNFRGNNSKTKIVPAIIPEMLPGQTLTFTLGVKTGAHQEFNTYAWIETPWNLKGPEATDYITTHFYQSPSNGVAKVAKAPAAAGIFNGCADDPCSLAERGGWASECACGTSLALGGTLGGIQNALHNRYSQAMRNQLAQSGLFDAPGEYFPDQYLPSPADLYWYWFQHCLSGKAGQMASVYNEQRQMLDNPNCRDPHPHRCNPYNPGDPNEMHGYLSDAGSKYISNNVKEVGYTIEFENDPEIANASAHKIVVNNKLDADVFDLTSFKPTRVQIGDKTVELDGNPNFTKTVDMRPAINAIAQIDLDYDSEIGVAQWTITSLDPMTMEETYDIMQGVLPVNNNGDGVGFLSYNIGIKKQFEDGDKFSNSATITFDFEAPIETPVWTNTVDAVAPESEITFAAMQDNVVTLRFDAEDNRSGIWKYLLYVQDTEGGNWTKVEDEITTSEYKFKGYSGFDYGFCVRAVDMAGNEEQKELKREVSQATFKYGDANGDGKVNSEDISLAVEYYINGKAALNFAAADMSKDGKINSEDISMMVDVYTSSSVKQKMRKARRKSLTKTNL